MNPLTENLITGTAGELLVQLRLFQYGVQAAPPLKDTGNDLIAVRGRTFRAVQVKTTGVDRRLQEAPDRLYHILAYVRLSGEGNNYFLDDSEIYLIEKNSIEKEGIQSINGHLGDFQISQDLVDILIPLT